ncbi:MAG: c-type cytochrome [Rudaea sp.]
MRRFFRWILGVAVVTVGALVIAMGFVYWRSNAMLAGHVDVKEAPLSIPDDAQAIERGKHLAITRGCGDCHASDFGGKMVIDVLPVGRIAAPNLTHGKGGLPANFSAADWERAVRHGIAPDGRMLLIMPIRDFAALTNEDMAEMIAFLQRLPSVDREEPAVSIGPIPRLQMLIGQVPLAEARMVDQHAAHVATIAPTASAEYGRYLSHTCSGCHGEHFSGGRVPGLPPSFPPAANISPDSNNGIGRWRKPDFVTAMRYGKRPNGVNIDPFMPWQTFKQMSDTELDALWLYLQTLPARQTGGR